MGCIQGSVEKQSNPCALVLNALLPAAVHWLLMVGGTYLCYECFEAIKDKLTASREDGTGQPRTPKPKTPEELVAYEKRKIAGAIQFFDVDDE